MRGLQEKLNLAEDWWQDADSRSSLYQYNWIRVALLILYSVHSWHTPLKECSQKAMLVVGTWQGCRAVLAIGAFGHGQSPGLGDR